MTLDQARCVVLAHGFLWPLRCQDEVVSVATELLQTSGHDFSNAPPASPVYGLALHAIGVWCQTVLRHAV